jgi:hypothetical protein
LRFFPVGALRRGAFSLIFLSITESADFDVGRSSIATVRPKVAAMAQIALIAASAATGRPKIRRERQYIVPSAKALTMRTTLTLDDNLLAKAQATYKFDRRPRRTCGVDRARGRVPIGASRRQCAILATPRRRRWRTWQQFQFGLDTFGDITLAPDGSLLAQAEVIRNVIEEGVHADALGVDTFGVGEHHRPDFAVSAPEVVLAAIAGRSRRIRLGSAVTVLSSDDPIRVFQRFSTLNAASNGRAEVTLGRGSFIESFQLFGYDLSQYEELFGRSSTCLRPCSGAIP